MNSCSKCIFKPFCQSPGPACSSFKDKENFVEVVRCKDCKYYTAEKMRCDRPEIDYDIECYDEWINTKPNDFCSYGKRN